VTIKDDINFSPFHSLLLIAIESKFIDNIRLECSTVNYMTKLKVSSKVLLIKPSAPAKGIRNMIFV
jgi:hypothetical protein